MKLHKRILAMLLSVATICGTVGCGSNEETKEYSIELQNVYDGETVDLVSPIVREYLNATEEEQQVKLLLSNAGMKLDYQPLSFSWQGDGESETYTVYFADNEAFEDPITYETKNTYLDMVGCFVPGKIYYWKVVGDAEGSTSKVDTFQTLDAPVRYISTMGIQNVRDIGGWKTEDGKTVKYEMLYRGGRTNLSGGNECMVEDKELFTKKLGIRVEIDLRGQNKDDGNQTMSVFGDSVKYYKSTYAQYSYIYPEFEQTFPVKRVYDGQSKYSAKEIFEVLADEKNYPMFFHCNAGADRTGTLTFLINGLLGVSYEDLTRDFELTSFSKQGPRFRSGVEAGTFDSSGVYQDNQENYVAWGKLYDMMMQGYGTGDGKLSSAIENYLINVCEIEQSTLDTVRNILLED